VRPQIADSRSVDEFVLTNALSLPNIAPKFQESGVSVNFVTNLPKSGHCGQFTSGMPVVVQESCDEPDNITQTHLRLSRIYEAWRSSIDANSLHLRSFVRRRL
jgi:hypothetical protein